ncbi:hypothetical protein BSKO_10385 [Bryopsis sp. KO-2023]|nr:hypothetical protein BSKO_10385 [Bryopsis sp. KO-2023]
MPVSSRNVSFFRSLAVAGSACLVWFSSDVNAWIQRAWDVLRESRVFRHDSFEPLLVTASVAVFSVFFRVLDTRFTSELKAWRINESDDMSHWKFEGGKRLRGEFLWYWAVLGIFDFLYPRRKLPLGAPTLAQIAVEVLGALFLYDHFFFWVHLALHKVPFLYKNVHSKHHTKKVMRAWESWRLTFFEQAADVACSIAALNVPKCHPLSRAIYNIIVVYLITELHSGYDMPWMLQNIIPCGLWGGSRRHDFHHRYGGLYYQKFFTYMDNIIVRLQNQGPKNSIQ